MVRAIFLAATIALVAIYSRETVAKTLLNPSKADPAITKHTKDIDEGDLPDAGLHHRGERSPSSDEQDDFSDSKNPSDSKNSGGGSIGGYHQSSSASTASPGHGVPVRRNPRGRRPVFSKLQVAQLEKSFNRKKYLSLLERTSLAASVGLTESQVKRWFQRRRIKIRQEAAATFNNLTHIIHAIQTLQRKHFLHHFTTMLGRSGTDIGGSVASSAAAPSFASGCLPYGVGVGISGWGVPTGGPGTFDPHRQPQSPPVHVQSDSTSSDQVHTQPTTPPSSVPDSILRRYLS